MSKALRYLGLVGILLAANVYVVNGAIGEWGTLEPNITRLTSDGRSYAERELGWSPAQPYIAYYKADTSRR